MSPGISLCSLCIFSCPVITFLPSTSFSFQSSYLVPELQIRKNIIQCALWSILQASCTKNLLISMVAPSPAEIQYQLAHIHEDRSLDIILSHAICLPIAVIAVVLRLVSRRLIKDSIQADDWLIIVALLFAAGEITGGLLCVRNGGGKHAILLEDPLQFAKLVFATELMYDPAIAAVKLSVLLLYRRLFPNRRFRIILWCVGGFIVCYSSIQNVMTIFDCHPIEAIWNPFVKGTCIDLNTLAIVMGILNIVTDFVTLILPMPLLWRLQISRVWKLQLMGIFLTGGM